MMKRIFLLGLTAFFLLAGTTAFSAPFSDKTAETNTVEKADLEAFEAEWNTLSKKEKKAKRKAMRKQIKSTLKKYKKQKSGSVDDTTLLVIIAIFIPFLAMGLYDGITKRFWISLLLTLLFFLPGLIYTLVIILRGD